MFPYYYIQEGGCEIVSVCSVCLFLVGLLGEDLRWVFAQLRNYEVND